MDGTMEVTHHFMSPYTLSHPFPIGMYALKGEIVCGIHMKNSSAWN